MPLIGFVKPVNHRSGTFSGGDLGAGVARTDDGSFAMSGRVVRITNGTGCIGGRARTRLVDNASGGSP